MSVKNATAKANRWRQRFMVGEKLFSVKWQQKAADILHSYTAFNCSGGGGFEAHFVL
jgi:hypothetical protein